MKAILVAAGSGSRLKPFSLTGSKIMTKFLGRPLLFYHIDEFLEYGLKEIIIICNRDNFSEIKKETKKVYKKIKIQFVVQDFQLGPSHAIYSAKALLNGEEYFLFKYADSVHSEDLVKPLLDEFNKNPQDGVIILRKVKHPKRYGIARLEGKKVIEIVEKPEHAPSNLGLVGAGILNTKKFIAGLERDELFSGKKEVAPPEYVLREGGGLGYYVYKGKREDLGKPYDILLTAKLMLKRFKGARESRKISRNAKIDKNSFIGKKAEIGKNVVVKNYSIVEGKVGDNTIIDGSVIMEGTTIGNGCKIKNSVIGRKCVIKDGFTTKVNSGKVFIKNRYEETEMKRLGVFIGDHVRIEGEISAEGGKVVFPHKHITSDILSDHLVRVILYDADNTLFNTSQVAAKADMVAMKYFAQQGKRNVNELYTYWKEEIVSKLRNEKDPHKRHRLYSYGILAKKFGCRDPEKAFLLALQALLKDIKLFPNVEKALKGLGKYRLAIASESPSDVLVPKLRTLNIDSYFQVILSSDSVGIMKPDKEYFEIALQALGVCPYECLVIGDNYEKDLEIPQKLGAKTVFYGEKSKAHFSIMDHKELSRIMEEV